MTIVSGQRADGAVAPRPAEPLRDLAPEWRGLGRPAQGRHDHRARSAPPPAPGRPPATTNGHAMPPANRAAPTAGPTSWFIVTRRPSAGRCRCRGRALATTIGSSVPVVVSTKTSAVPSRNIATRTTVMFTVAGDQRGGQHDEDARPAARSTAIDEPPAVDPVGEDAGVQAEQQPGQPLQQPGQRDEDRVGGLRGDQQRAGGERDAVAEVAHPGRADQPPERRPHPAGQHGFHDSAHEKGTLRDAPGHVRRHSGARRQPDRHQHADVAGPVGDPDGQRRDRAVELQHQLAVAPRVEA